MKYCEKCILPDTRPNTNFEDDGVCVACHSTSTKSTIDWAAREKQLKELCDKYRKNNGEYDCLIPVSGGKDSTYQVYVMKKKYNMNPLCVTFLGCPRTDAGNKNTDNLKNLGVDHILYSPNPVVYRKLVKYGFENMGTPCWPCHYGMYLVPVKVAIQYKIPLVVWGENPEFEYGNNSKDAQNAATTQGSKWLRKYSGLVGKTMDDAIGFEGLEKKDFKLFEYPEDKEMDDLGLTQIFLGYFLRWDVPKQLALVKELGFTTLGKPHEGTYTDYENIDSTFSAIHHYMKYLKFGFNRATDSACREIRNGIMTREEGKKLAEEYDGNVPQEYRKFFIDYLGITDEEYEAVFDKYTNKEIFETDEKGNLKRDERGRLIKKYKA